MSLENRRDFVRWICIALGALLLFLVGAAEGQGTAYSLDNIIGVWSGRMVNVNQGSGSDKGIDTRFVFEPDGTGGIRGAASFQNLDLGTRATGMVEKVDLQGDRVRFILVYRGGAPGVDGTKGDYRLRFADPGVLTGESENYETRSYLRLRLEKKK
jgi:hypothetical protein